MDKFVLVLSAVLLGNLLSFVFAWGLWSVRRYHIDGKMSVASFCAIVMPLFFMVGGIFLYGP